MIDGRISFKWEQDESDQLWYTDIYVDDTQTAAIPFGFNGNQGILSASLKYIDGPQMNPQTWTQISIPLNINHTPQFVLVTPVSEQGRFTFTVTDYSATDISVSVYNQESVPFKISFYAMAI